MTVFIMSIKGSHITEEEALKIPDLIDSFKACPATDYFQILSHICHIRASSAGVFCGNLLGKDSLRLWHEVCIHGAGGRA